MLLMSVLKNTVVCICLYDSSQFFYLELYMVHSMFSSDEPNLYIYTHCECVEVMSAGRGET